MSAIVHIASLLVHHKPESAGRLDAVLDAMPQAELALREGGRSVVLCEAADEARILDCIDALGQAEGVIGVSLVHHHAEDEDSLIKEMDDGHAT